MNRLRNRREAGRLLAERLGSYAGRSDVVVLGLPRGGVVVAFEVAVALRVPSTSSVRIRLPATRVGMVAIASGASARQPGCDLEDASPRAVEAAVRRQQAVWEQRERTNAEPHRRSPMEGRT